MKMIGTISVSDAYMEMLGTLPNEDKLDLIQGLELDNWKSQPSIIIFEEKTMMREGRKSSLAVFYCQFRN